MHYFIINCKKIKYSSLIYFNKMNSFTHKYMRYLIKCKIALVVIYTIYINIQYITDIYTKSIDFSALILHNIFFQFYKNKLFYYLLII
jgi:hypothetical protein